MAEATDFWTPTIEAYAALQLPSPELTPKLLKRPPFRFIHDIVAAINARFAAYNHVIPAAYVDAACIDTKEKKIEYLEILITYVEKLLKVSVDANPKKIVAGSEPEKTNVFLQYLAMAVGLAQQDRGAVAQNTGAEAKPKDKERKRNKDKDSSHEAKTGSNKREEEEVPPPPPPPETPDDKTNGTAKAAGGKQLTGASSSLPHRDELPRKKSSLVDSSVKKAANQAAMSEAESFNKKLAGFSLNLDGTNGPGDVRSDNQSIVKMWRELQTPKVETTPSTMPEESLEIAIDRLLKNIRQVQGLMRENDKVIDKLEDLLV